MLECRQSVVHENWGPCTLAQAACLHPGQEVIVSGGVRVKGSRDQSRLPNVAAAVGKDAILRNRWLNWPGHKAVGQADVLQAHWGCRQGVGAA